MAEAVRREAVRLLVLRRVPVERALVVLRAVVRPVVLLRAVPVVLLRAVPVALLRAVDAVLRAVEAVLRAVDWVLRAVVPAVFWAVVDPPVLAVWPVWPGVLLLVVAMLITPLP